MQGSGLVKTRNFKKPVYVGDPINAVKIFNGKEVDELVILDIGATPQRRAPDVARLRDIASEAFMPLCYGGGISTFSQAVSVFSAGFEKVAINTASFSNLGLMTEIASHYGSQSVVAGIDVKKDWLGRARVVARCGYQATGHGPVDWARRVVDAGAGEVLLNSVDRDGCREGYDLRLVREVSDAVRVPVVACGGAGNMEHLAEALRSGASAVAAGSMFVFCGARTAVLISYPSPRELEKLPRPGVKKLFS
jgi:cyclase